MASASQWIDMRFIDASVADQVRCARGLELPPPMCDDELPIMI
jgi:hypothetical protein